jgi:hypothetical protein
MGYSFRTKEYRYTVWINKKKSTVPIFKEDIHAEELYDYINDPLETENKIDNEEYRKIKITHQSLATRYFKDQVAASKSAGEKIKNNNTYKRAQFISEFIINAMRLTNTRGRFLMKTLSEKYAHNAAQTKGKNLPKSTKRDIYKATFIETRNKLSKIFSKIEIAQINKLEKRKMSELNNN